MSRRRRSGLVVEDDLDAAGPPGGEVVDHGEQDADDEAADRVDERHEQRAGAEEQPRNAEQSRHLGGGDDPAGKKDDRGHDQADEAIDQAEHETEAHGGDLQDAKLFHVEGRREAAVLIWSLNCLALAASTRSWRSSSIMTTGPVPQLARHSTNSMVTSPSGETSPGWQLNSFWNWSHTR